MDKEEFLKRMGQKIRDLRNDRAWTLYDKLVELLKYQ